MPTQGGCTAKHRVHSASVARVYPHYVAKAETGRTKAEVDELATGKAMEKIVRK